MVIKNAQATLDWIVRQQQLHGALEPSLKQLVLMGSSAGSIGIQLWSPRILQLLKWQTAVVVPDSYAGVFPPSAQGPLITSFGFCSNGFLSDRLEALCRAGNLTLQVINMEMQQEVNVPYTFIQSKNDIVQMAYYDLIGFTTGTYDMILPGFFFAEANKVWELYNPLPNFAVFIIDGMWHEYANQARFYNATATSATGGICASGELLYHWVSRLPLTPGGGCVSTVCAGICDSTLQHKTVCR
jgi:hypothetical protein